MWKAIILACGLLDNQPVQCMKMVSENGFENQAVCERSLIDTKIQIATKLTMRGLSPRVHGECMNLGE